jgi:hypothetical protein
MSYIAVQVVIVGLRTGFGILVYAQSATATSPSPSLEYWTTAESRLLLFEGTLEISGEIGRGSVVVSKPILVLGRYHAHVEGLICVEDMVVVS